MKTYTPGPWFAGPSHGEILYKKLGHPYGKLAQVCTDKQVDGTGDYGLSPDEVEANAALIVAAPRMLEALELLHANKCESELSPHRVCALCTVIKDARGYK